MCFWCSWGYLTLKYSLILWHWTSLPSSVYREFTLVFDKLMINNMSIYFHCCLPSHVRLFATPWTAACQASLSRTIFQSLPKFMSFQSAIYFHKENKMKYTGRPCDFKTTPFSYYYWLFSHQSRHAILIFFSGYLSLLLCFFYLEYFSLEYTLVFFSLLNLYVVSSERLYLIILSTIAHLVLSTPWLDTFAISSPCLYFC